MIQPQQAPAPVNDLAQAKLREYAEAYHGYLMASAFGGERKREAARRVNNLETMLIADLTANAANAEVERRAIELDGLVDTVRERTEALLNAIAKATVEAGRRV